MDKVGSKKSIVGLSLLVLAQVVLFMIVYLATIAVGAGLVYFVFHASLWIIPPFFGAFVPEMMRFGKLGLALIVIVVIAIVGLWAFVAAVGVYLVKPMLIFPKRKKDYGREIHREDSPQLYDMIMETAKAAGVRRPKHIYVNHEVNACVFFNTGFWNIFLPVRKNLAIGLGLFESTNTEEVKSVIAHEFGHFAQGSMHVGSVLYVSNKVITDLVYRRDWLDSLMLRWCLEDGIWGFWGVMTQSIVIKFRDLVEYLYRCQQRNYMKLSRQMEYDADAVACRIVGTETFVSALCKIQKIDRSFDFYNRALVSFANQDQTVSDYWKGYELSIPNMEAMGMKSITCEELETVPDVETARSRVSIEEIWESHPSIESRIDHAHSLAIMPCDTSFKKSAWEMVDPSLKAEVSSGVIKLIIGNRENVSTIDWKYFSEQLAKKIEYSFFPKEVEVFFARRIITDMESSEDNDPLTDENRGLILEYEQALNDKHLLSLLKEGKVPVKHFLYNGIDHTVTSVPVDEHEKYVNGLKEKVGKIDAGIKALAMSKTEDKSLIIAAYDAIGYAQPIIALINEDYLPVRDDMIKALNEAKIAGEGDYASLRDWIDSYEKALKDVLNNLRYRQVAPFMSQEEHKHIIDFLDRGSSFSGGIDGDAVGHMFSVTDWILRVHDRLSHSAKKVIVNVILDKELPDLGFLELWRSRDADSYKDTGHDSSRDTNTSPSADSGEHLVIDSAYGRLDLRIPTYEEIDVVYYQEWFRCRMWEKFEQLERGHKFDYGLVATVPFNEMEGRITCANPEDEQKFLAEIQEYYRFLETQFQEPDWRKMSDLADQGSPHANCRMAELYLSQKRHNMAFGAAMKGALAGDSDGMVILGILESSGPERNPELAVNLFKCASVGGNMHALCNLGLRYAKGDGIEQNESRAVRLFERAASQGNTYAQNNVGYMYLNGKGVEPDPERGLFWLYKAANNGYETAVNTIWQYHKSIGDTEQYIKIVQQGAMNGIEACRIELDLINMSGSVNFDMTGNNPRPVHDTAIGQGLCPVCGKPVGPRTTTCPHCKEIIREE